MALYIRMIVYALSAGAAGYGFASFDPEAGTVTFQLDTLAQMLGGALAFVGTFLVGRIAKRNGGAT
jgi:hypothetical protein